MADSSTTLAMSKEGESITYSSGTASRPPDLRFIHYNDVYHVEPGSREPVGGIARFTSLCRFYQEDQQFQGQPKVMTFFSGDAFNPSLESSVTKGKHMVPALNRVDTTVACLGNHDLDFGVEQFEHLAAQCKFPWLCANVLDPALGEGVPLGHCKPTVMLESSNGIKVGVIGVVEREWLDTINSLPPNVQYFSASATVSKLAPQLRADGADIVVVVSHQRQPNDEKLARNVAAGTVDIVLGGHDHYYDHAVINGIHVLRSGSDYKQLSYLELRRKADGSKGWDVDIVRRDVVSSIPQDPAVVDMVEKITANLRAKLEKPIGYTIAPLDARFTTVRVKESNLGNFVCDLMRLHYAADCCLIAAGTIRGDQIYPPGVLRVKDVMSCFPFEDPCVVIGIPGSEIVAALENSVSKYPALEGRFPQVSNITFTFDPSRPEGERCLSVKVGGKPIEAEHEYKMVTRDYMVRGKDGYTSLMLREEGGKARSIVSDENGILLSMILRQYFMSLRVMGKWKNWGKHLGQHWESVQGGLHEVHPVQEPKPRGDEEDGSTGKAQSNLLRPPPDETGTQPQDATHELSDSEEDESERPPEMPSDAAQERKKMLARKVMRKWWRLTGLPGHPNMCSTQSDDWGATWTKGICPRTEGRITMVGGA